MDLIDVIADRLGPPVRISYPEHLFLCPFCIDKIGKEDTSGHLYVNEDAGFCCHRCNSQGSTRWLLRMLRISADDIAGPVPEMTALRVRAVMSSVLRGETSEDYVPPEVRLPENVDYPWNMPDVWNYAKKRCLSRFACEHYGLLGWIDKRNNTRLLFPDYVDGNLVFWQARAVEDGIEPKYRTVDGAEKSHCVWNLDRIDVSRPVYVAEGILSARACGTNGVALYGKSLSSVQLKMLRRKIGPSGVRIVMDGSAFSEAFEMARTLMRSRVPVGVVKLPGKMDPDDMRYKHPEYRDELDRLLLQSQPLTESGLLRMRLNL